MVTPCAGQPSDLRFSHFRLNGKTTPVAINTCNPTPHVRVEAQAAFNFKKGSYKGELGYRYQVLRGSKVLVTREGWIPIADGTMTLPELVELVEAANDSYRVTVQLSGNSYASSNAIPVTVNVKDAPSTAMSRINGNPEINHVSVMPDEPIILDGSSSVCPTGYFIGVELSDQAWNRLGGGFGHWITKAEFDKYGGIAAFNLRKWAEDRGYVFSVGRYHRVKLAVGTPWNERTQLLFVKPFGPEAGEIRLRHKATGNCLFGGLSDGSAVRNWQCWNDPNMIFILDRLGGNEVRIRHKMSKRCVFGSPANGGAAGSWSCWDDPNMVFVVDDLGNGEIRLRHKNTNRCLLGNPQNNAIVRSYSCSNDSNMVFIIDPL